MRCSFCSNGAIFVSGKAYCRGCLGNHDVSFFERAVINLFTSKHQIIDFFEWAFGTGSPKISDLSKWHGRIRRREKGKDNWRSHGIYVESQDWYIRRIAKEYFKYREEAKDEVSK